MNADLKQHILNSLNKNLRLDGRKEDEYREVSIEYGISNSAEGSARVKIGDTEVLAGVKMELGKPYPDKQDEGTIMVGAELLPLSSPDFESGPPGIQSIELARVVDRGIRESKTVDFKKLCIEKGEKIWILLIDIVTINDDGNLFDAASLAALAALKDAKFPEIVDDKVNYKKKTKKSVPLEKLPISITVLKIGDKFIIDPLSDEEKVYDARLTVATTDDGSICAMQKGGDGPLTTEDIGKMIQLGIDKGKVLRKTIG